ncbi:MAG: hypothetical protein PWQ25_2170 [Deferribacteres bacterium]|jgi:hypothetical protein|nr:hypothetical protein [Deferribacteraceae bacterium]MDK2793307.1 hypothetical protein [Deferribacteres bacterium]
MAIRNDYSININLNNIENFTTRDAVRTFLLQQWAQENQGQKYRYFVETLSDGSRIYLERPGRLNKGCDFVIYAENKYLWNNGNDRPPDHNFVLNDLRNKKQLLSQAQWQAFLNGVNIMYNCGTYLNALGQLGQLPVGNGHNYELILKLTRWFFIEQDVTYWSGQGRAMFYDAILSI